jgi:hypothetical protein
MNLVAKGTSRKGVEISVLEVGEGEWMVTRSDSDEVRRYTHLRQCLGKFCIDMLD